MKKKERKERDAKRQMLIEKRQLADEKTAHPERCFCPADGIYVERSLENDDVLGVEIDGIHEQKVYKCPRCGGAYKPQRYFYVQLED